MATTHCERSLLGIKTEFLSEFRAKYEKIERFKVGGKIKVGFWQFSEKSVNPALDEKRYGGTMATETL